MDLEGKPMHLLKAESKAPQDSDFQAFSLKLGNKSRNSDNSLASNTEKDAKPGLRGKLKGQFRTFEPSNPKQKCKNKLVERKGDWTCKNLCYLSSISLFPLTVAFRQEVQEPELRIQEDMQQV